MTPRLGLAYVPTLPPERLRSVALACDAHLDDLWLWEDCFNAAAVRALARAGVTHVVIQPTQDEPDLEGFIALLGEQVRPLLG